MVALRIARVGRPPRSRTTGGTSARSGTTSWRPAFWIGGERPAGLHPPWCWWWVSSECWAAYPLGRRWGGRWVGAPSALFVATSAGHIAFTSRVAWSHSTTPLFVTIGAWALVSAAPGGVVACSAGPRRVGRPRLGPRVPDAPDRAGAAAWSGHLRRVASGDPLLASRWMYVAGLLFCVVVNLNLLLYNLQAGFDSIEEGIEQSGEYAGGRAAHGTAVPGALLSCCSGCFSQSAARSTSTPARPNCCSIRGSGRSPCSRRPALALAMATRQPAARAPWWRACRYSPAGQRQVQPGPERPHLAPFLTVSRTPYGWPTSATTTTHISSSIAPRSCGPGGRARSARPRAERGGRQVGSASSRFGGVPRGARCRAAGSYPTYLLPRAAWIC